ncbi:MAG: helix-turn-helix domain-containing protein [Kiritimatiellae bacterium]|nr:helix-turn-helix domain-containing protein [Kiritimatiellia bacterium]
MSVLSSARVNPILLALQPPHEVSVRVVDGGWIRLHAWHFDNLTAPYWRFYWNTDRGAHMLLNGQRTDLLPSRCYLIPPQTNCAARLERSVTHFCMHFMTTPRQLRLAPGIYSCPPSKPMRLLFEELRRRLKTDQALNLRTSLLAHTLAYEVLYRVPGDHLTFERLDERMDGTLRHMEANLATPLSNVELARRAGMGLNAFIRLYKQTMGHTPQQDYARMRLDRAVFLLLSSDLSVKAIADSAGFCDRYHFSHVFARHYRMGPAQFRRMHSRRVTAS